MTARDALVLLAVALLAGVASSRRPRPAGPRIVPVRRPDGTVIRVFVDQRVTHPTAKAGGFSGNA